VLFFAGISLRFRWNPVRAAVLTMGAVVLVDALARVGTPPTY
jgi:hypothetical protein